MSHHLFYLATPPSYPSAQLSGKLFRQGSLAEVAHTLEKMSLKDLGQALQDLQINQKVLVFLLLDESTAVHLFQQLSPTDKIMLLQAMDPFERNWLLSALHSIPDW
ncbi:MAG: hypothetical protein Q6K80_01290 [Thermostichus sp. DG_1_6_bins_120]